MVNNPRCDVTSLGEMMLRLSVPSGRRLEAAAQLDVYPAGAESNVTSLLARLGRRTRWVGALPENPLGRLAASCLREAGVALDGIIWRKTGRMGTYYVEFGAPPRGIRVVYDRAGSCASQLQPADIDWDALLDTRLLHLTGITPALSSSCCEIVVEALRRARLRNVPVSFDVNYRQNLWPESEAAETLSPLIRGVDLLFCSAADAARLFQFTGDMQAVAQAMLEYSQARSVVITFGEQGILLWDGQSWQRESARPTEVVDRLGAGDALAAGLIHGWLDGEPTAGGRYGVILAALALSQFGDMVVTTRAELESLLGGQSILVR
jgi:2-dehydro-3-deoxygluconokinase